MLESLKKELKPLPLPVSFAIVGGTCAAALGGVVGLILGLSYPPTAVIAIFEVGIPATIVGAAAGLLIGCFATLARAAWRLARTS